MDDLVTVYTVANPVEAEIIKGALEEEGIRCFLDGANQAGETGLLVFEIKVQVPARDAERARTFIEAHEKSRARGTDIEEGRPMEYEDTDIEADRPME